MRFLLGGASVLGGVCLLVGAPSVAAYPPSVPSSTTLVTVDSTVAPTLSVVETTSTTGVETTDGGSVLGVTGGPDESPNGGTPGTLPQTGSGSPATLAGIGAILLTAGGIVTVARRRPA